jgi:hypothetical protein
MSSAPARAAAQAVRELGGRLAAAAALLVALVSLLQHAPLWLACLRGSAALVGLALVARLGSAALERAIESDHARAQAEKQAGDAPPSGKERA